MLSGQVLPACRRSVVWPARRRANTGMAGSQENLTKRNRSCAAVWAGCKTILRPAHYQGAARDCSVALARPTVHTFVCRGLAMGKSVTNADVVRARTSERSQVLLAWLSGLVVGMLGLSYAFVPLYRMFCQATGYGGTANEASRGGGETLTGMEAVAQSRLLTIEFTSDVSPELAWTFDPAQRFVRVQPGETALAFYNATNSQSEAVTGISTYNVSPQKAGVYFHKIQCFCFEEQRLQVCCVSRCLLLLFQWTVYCVTLLLPHKFVVGVVDALSAAQSGETIDMPVFFYIDPDFAADPRVRYAQGCRQYAYFKPLFSTLAAA